jgi:hypothetical protein
MSCIIRAGVCHVQVSYFIATVFVVGSSFVLFRLENMSISYLILIGFNVNHELRDVYSDYVPLMLFHPHSVSLQQNSETLLRSSTNRYVKVNLHNYVRVLTFSFPRSSTRIRSLCATGEIRVILCI